MDSNVRGGSTPLSRIDRRRPFVHADSVAELRDWLESHHAGCNGAWLVTWKKNSGGPHLSWAEIVPGLLAYGWIDSKSKRFDEDRRQLTITPRRPRSNWSKRNKEIVERLLAEKRMKPAGIAMVELAKASGTWSALDSVEALEERVGEARRDPRQADRGDRRAGCAGRSREPTPAAGVTLSAHEGADPCGIDGVAEIETSKTPSRHSGSFDQAR